MSAIIDSNRSSLTDSGTGAARKGRWNRLGSLARLAHSSLCLFLHLSRSANEKGCWIACSHALPRSTASSRRASSSARMAS